MALKLKTCFHSIIAHPSQGLTRQPSTLGKLEMLPRFQFI